MLSPSLKSSNETGYEASWLNSATSSNSSISPNSSFLNQPSATSSPLVSYNQSYYANSGMNYWSPSSQRYAMPSNGTNSTPCHSNNVYTADPASQYHNYNYAAVLAAVNNYTTPNVVYPYQTPSNFYATQPATPNGYQNYMMVDNNNQILNQLLSNIKSETRNGKSGELTVELGEQQHQQHQALLTSSGGGAGEQDSGFDTFNETGHSASGEHQQSSNSSTSAVASPPCISSPSRTTTAWN